MAEIIGRLEEIATLKSAIASKEAELIAIYGRRRIGKTYLIRNYYEDRIAFELTGMNNGTLKAQLLQFSKALQKATNAPLPLAPPQNWVEAFTALELMLSTLSKKKKWVVFLMSFHGSTAGSPVFWRPSIISGIPGPVASPSWLWSSVVPLLLG